MNNIDMMAWSASSMLNNKYGNTLIADCRKPLLVRVVVETLHHEEGAAWGGPSFMCSSEGDLKPASIHFHFCLFEISMLVRQSVLKRIARNRGHWKYFFPPIPAQVGNPSQSIFPQIYGGVEYGESGNQETKQDGVGSSWGIWAP